MSAAPRLTATENRDEWLAARREVITATDMAAILNLHPYRSPRMVYLDKLGLLPEVQENEAMHWGNVLEPVVIAEFERRHNLDVAPGSFVRMESEPFGATPDGLIGDDELLEAKTAGIHAGQNFGPSGTDEVPAQYLCQVMHQMMVTGRKTGHLAVLIGGNDYREYVIKRDQKFIGRMRFMGRKFMAEYVTQGIEPPITGSHADRVLLEGQFKEADGDEIVSSPEIDDIAAHLGNLLEEQRELGIKVEHAKNQIREFMGESPAMKSIHGYFTWKPQSRARIDWPTVIRTCNIDPEVIAANTVDTGFRVFKTPFKSDKA